MSISTSTVTAGSFRTTYLEAGDPEAPTVILLHDGAFGTTADLCWRPVIEDLQADYHVLAPDMLGWGGTDKAVFLDRSPYAFRLAHLVQWREALGVDSAYAVGTSFGGSLVVRALVEAGNPLGITKGVSISGTGGPYRLPAGIEALGNYEPSLEDAERLTALVVDDTSGLAEHVSARYHNSLAPGHWEAMTAPKLRNPASRPERPADSFPDSLADIEVPLLLVEGARDQLLEPGWADKLAAYGPLVTATVVDAAHEPNIDRPELVARVVRDFFSGTDDGNGGGN